MSSLRSPWLFFVVLAVVAIGCSGGSGSVPPNSPTQSAGTPTPAGATPTPAGATPTPSARPTASPTPGPTATATATPVPGATPPTPNPAISFAPGFYANVVANVGGAREIAALPNGDILVGTGGSTIYIVPGAESATASVSPKAFITLSETPADSIILAPNGSLYAATNTKIWKIPYHTGDQSEPNSSATVIALVRQGPVSPGTDGDVHVSTSVAASASKLYAGVGSSCNQCIETDPTRASIQVMNLDGSGMTTLATRIRNPIAVTINPATGTLWAGGAGQDNLTYTHPYEYFDPVTLESPVPAPSPAGATYVDYGWPACEENHHLYNPLGTSPPPDCSKTVEPRVEFPAYSTLIGATFYPASQTGTYAFPSAYRGGAYVTSHGSWHCCPSTLPRLYYVPMSGDTPATAMNWSAPDPTSQSQQIMYDFGGSGSTSYIGRPTGVAVGASGSLFVGDDATGNIYRIRHH